MNSVRMISELAFAKLIKSMDVQISEADGELHIIADNWTLVLQGDPITGVIIAMDDESGPPNPTIGSTLTEADIAALRQLNNHLAGEVFTQLRESPDVLAQALSTYLIA